MVHLGNGIGCVQNKTISVPVKSTPAMDEDQVLPLFFVELTVSPLTLHQVYYPANHVLVPRLIQLSPLHITL